MPAPWGSGEGAGWAFFWLWGLGAGLAFAAISCCAREPGPAALKKESCGPVGSVAGWAEGTAPNGVQKSCGLALYGSPFSNYFIGVRNGKLLRKKERRSSDHLVPKNNGTKC